MRILVDIQISVPEEVPVVQVHQMDVAQPTVHMQEMRPHLEAEVVPAHIMPRVQILSVG